MNLIYPLQKSEGALLFPADFNKHLLPIDIDDIKLRIRQAGGILY